MKTDVKGSQFGGGRLDVIANVLKNITRTIKEETGIMEQVEKWLTSLSNFVWGPHLLILLVGTGSS